jgi:hypothetical protein
MKRVQSAVELCGFTVRYADPSRLVIVGAVDNVLVDALKSLDGVTNVTRFTPKALVVSSISPYGWARKAGQNDDDKYKIILSIHKGEVEVRGRRIDVESISHRIDCYRPLLEACRKVQKYFDEAHTLDLRHQRHWKADLLTAISDVLMRAQRHGRPEMPQSVNK